MVVPSFQRQQRGLIRRALRLNPLLGVPSAGFFLSFLQVFFVSIGPPYIAGIGCRVGCGEAELRGLLEDTLAAAGLRLDDLSGLASVAHKRDEAGLLALAAQLQLPLSWLSPEQLRAADDRVGQTSAVALQATGAPSVAEASALMQVEVVSGKRANLRIGKHSSAQATVAVAGVEEQA